SRRADVGPRVGCACDASPTVYRGGSLAVSHGPRTALSTGGVGTPQGDEKSPIPEETTDPPGRGGTSLSGGLIAQCRLVEIITTQRAGGPPVALRGPPPHPPCGHLLPGGEEDGRDCRAKGRGSQRPPVLALAPTGRSLG